MDNLRREQLIDNWNEEGRDDDTEWREDLTPEELDFVEGLDRRYDCGILKMASRILIMEKIRAKYSPAEIMELEGVGEHYRLRLRDGSLFLARLGNDNSLLLTEIDEVC